MRDSVMYGTCIRYGCRHVVDFENDETSLVHNPECVAERKELARLDDEREYCEFRDSDIRELKHGLNRRRKLARATAGR